MFLLIKKTMEVLYWTLLSYNKTSNLWTVILGALSAAWYSQIHPNHATRYHWAVVNTIWLLGLKLYLIYHPMTNWVVCVIPSMVCFALELAYGVHLSIDGYSPGILIVCYSFAWLIVLGTFVAKSMDKKNATPDSTV